ncbi:MAG: ferredoxin [Planctomycetota bacterium]|nr:MAG: ferredoxin [Planctomycetota bacterium]
MTTINLKINDQPVTAEKGETVLQVARRNGVRIPTLCYLEGLQAIGACRMCLVEVKKARGLVPACVTEVAEGMEVFTRTKRVREARKTILELILSDHPFECNTCERNQNCELQKLAEEFGIREITYEGEHSQAHVDDSTAALVRDSSKCILCRRCVAVCNEIQGVSAINPIGRGFEMQIGPSFNDPLESAACVLCGQCAAVCPVGAIKEKSHVKSVWAALEDPEKFVVVQTAPAVRSAIGECFDMPPGSLVTKKMVAALRRVGFDKVFDTEFAADLTIMEEGHELLDRLKRKLVDGEDVALPQITSCSPGWIKYMEHFFPQLSDNVSTCKSPQQMFGPIAKTYYAEKIGVDPARMYVVSIMPCTAKKYECERPEMRSSGYQDVDAVLTTREAGQMIKEAGIDFVNLPDEDFDMPLGASTGAADVFANTGGVMEAALRTVYEVVTGRELPTGNLHVKPIMGLKGVKEASLKIENAVPEWKFLEGVTVKVAVAHGLGNAHKALTRVVTGEADYQFIEIMACPGGCIGGGGQPRLTTDEVRRARIASIYKEDEGKKYRKSHENPAIKQLYEEFLGKPLGHKSHELLHTHYTRRGKFNELLAKEEREPEEAGLAK